LVTEHNIAVTDDEVQQFYINNLPMWTTPKSVRFSLIETATEADSVAARNRIVAGENFADVCQEVSTHPATRIYGGDIGGLVPEGYSTGERKLLEDTAFDLAVGEVSQPLLVEGKYYIITPTEKTEYSEPTLDEMRDYIHAGMIDNLVQPYLQQWMMGLMSNAEQNIAITYPIYAENPPSQFVPGAGGSFIAPSIATVYGHDITESTLLFHLLRQYGSATIQSLIEEMLFAEQSEAMDAGVTDEETRQSLLDVYDEARLNILNVAFGQDVVTGTLRQHLTALDVLGKKWQEIIEEHDIQITEEEITQHYLNNLHLWTRPEAVRFSMILVDTEEEANAARARIVAGESFESVCMEVSKHEATRIYGGDIGDLVPRGAASGENVPMLDTAFGLPIGGVSQPLHIGTGWFLIKTTEKQDAYEPTLADKREEITEVLLEDRVNPFLIGWRSTLWQNADIQVVYPIYSDNPTPDFSN
jgi:parvulin-like peptidyl-prolyl isomerase